MLSDQVPTWGICHFSYHLPLKRYAVSVIDNWPLATGSQISRAAIKPVKVSKPGRVRR